MSELLDKVRELGQNAEYKYGGSGVDSDGDGKPEYDCSGLITTAMRDLGYNLSNRLTTKSILSNSSGLGIGVGPRELYDIEKIVLFFFSETGL